MIVSLAIGFFLLVSAGVAGESYKPCLATWSYNEGSNTCVKAFNEKRVTWKKANKICQSKGSDLVLIQSSQKNDFVQGLLSRNRYWIGSRYNRDTKMMRYLDGGEVTPSFENWAPRQPNNYRGIQECIEIIRKRGGRWNDRSCRARKYFVCEKAAEEKQEKDIVTKFRKRPVQKCDSGWMYFDGDATCLLYKHDLVLNPPEALQYCNESFGGSLVIIRNDQKDHFIRDMILQDGREKDNVWIGLNIDFRLNTTFWLDGEPLGDYHPWIGGRPKRFPAYDCVYAYYHYNYVGVKKSLWSNDNCSSSKNHFICEVKDPKGIKLTRV